MDNRNETASPECRFLGAIYFDKLYRAFIEAFSDYVFPFALTETQFRNHINLNAVDLDRTVGYLKSGQILGFSLNGFGTWNGRSTVYDAGTGVVPSARRKGISRTMFDYMLPVFKSQGIEQCLLEVITNNHGAIRLYEQVGFHPARELALLQCDKPLSAIPPPTGLQLNEIVEPDWSYLHEFWDGEPSWQNSIPAVIRSQKIKRITAAFLEGRCVGYIAYSANFGRAAQIAVHKDFRNRGIGTNLLRKMQEQTAPGYSIQIINVDKAVVDTVRFFENRGFYERLSQYEMLKPL